MGHASPELVPMRGFGVSILQLMGLWWLEGRTQSAIIRASVTLLCLLVMQISPVLKLVMDPPTELEEITLNCLLVITFFSFTTKAVFFIYQGESLKQLMKLLHNSRKHYNSDTSSEAFRRSYIKLSRRVSLWMQAVTTAAIIAWVCTPPLGRIFFNSDNNSLESNRQFPMPLWIPGNMYVSPTYEVLYGVQTLVLLVAAESATAVDCFFIHLILMIAAELRVLNHKLSVMQKVNTNIRRDEYEDCSRKDGEDNKERTLQGNHHHTSTAYSSFEVVSDEKMCQLLVNHIRHHQIILRSVTLLQAVLNASVFALLFINMLGLCSCMFISAVLFQGNGNVTKALKLLMTIPCYLYETCVYCLFGQILTDQSENLANSAINCGWVECNACFKQDLLIFVMATKKPVEITVGKMYKLSKEMLVQVLKGSYGLLNVLYNFQSFQ